MILLIALFAGPAQADDRQDEALRSAAYRCEFEQVVAALAVGGDPNAVDRWGGVPMISAIRCEDLAVARALVAAGADVDGRAYEPRVTPLMVAADNGDAAAVRWLLSVGAEPGAVDVVGWGAIDRAVRQRHAEIVRLLLRAAEPADLARWRQRPLIALAAHGSVIAEPEATETVRLLLARGFDPDQASEDGTPLAIAASRGDLTLVEQLLDAGADPNAQPVFPAMGWAAHLRDDGQPLACAALLAPLVDDAETALAIAAAWDEPSLVIALLERGASPNATHEGRSALRAAVQQGAGRSVALLIAAGADVNAVGLDDRSAYIDAAARGDAVRMAVLESAGAHTWRDRGPAMVAAARGNHGAVARELLSDGAPVDAAGPDLDTALMWASHHADVALVRDLLAAGASDLRDAEGLRAADYIERAAEGVSDRLDELGRYARVTQMERSLRAEMVETRPRWQQIEAMLVAAGHAAP